MGQWDGLGGISRRTVISFFRDAMLPCLPLPFNRPTRTKQPPRDSKNNTPRIHHVTEDAAMCTSLLGAAPLRRLGAAAIAGGSCRSRAMRPSPTSSRASSFLLATTTGRQTTRGCLRPRAVADRWAPSLLLMMMLLLLRSLGGNKWYSCNAWHSSHRPNLHTTIACHCADCGRCRPRRHREKWEEQEQQRGRRRQQQRLRSRP